MEQEEVQEHRGRHRDKGPLAVPLLEVGQEPQGLEQVPLPELRNSKGNSGVVVGSSRDTSTDRPAEAALDFWQRMWMEQERALTPKAALLAWPC